MAGGRGKAREGRMAGTRMVERRSEIEKEMSSWIVGGDRDRDREEEGGWRQKEFQRKRITHKLFLSIFYSTYSIFFFIAY